MWWIFYGSSDSSPQVCLVILSCFFSFLPPAGGSLGRFPAPKQRRYSTNRGRTGLSSSERARVHREISLSQSSEYRCDNQLHSGRKTWFTPTRFIYKYIFVIILTSVTLHPLPIEGSQVSMLKFPCAASSFFFCQDQVLPSCVSHPSICWNRTVHFHRFTSYQHQLHASLIGGFKAVLTKSQDLFFFFYHKVATQIYSAKVKNALLSVNHD